MATIITAGNATNNGAAVSSDNTGAIELKTGTGAGTTAITVNASQNVGIGTSLPSAPLDVNGNFAITGSARRITGDFSNATAASRVLFQSSTTNGFTAVSVIPNGTSTSAFLQTINNADPANASTMQIAVGASESQLSASRTGTGTYLPMTFYTGGSERMRIDSSGNVLVTNPAGLGYGTGSGGTVTQATSKSTAVTLNKPTGKITMNNSAIAANTAAGFLVNNSLVSENDVVVLSFGAGVPGQDTNYALTSVCIAGGFYVALRNMTAASRSEAVVINFAIIKGATS